MAKQTIAQLIKFLSTYDKNDIIEFDFMLDDDSKTVSELFGARKELSPYIKGKLIADAKKSPSYYGLIETALTYVFLFATIEEANKFSEFANQGFGLKRFETHKRSDKLFSAIIFKAKK